MLIKTINFLIFLTILTNVNCAKRVKRIVGGVLSAAPPQDDPVVFVKLYARDSRVEGTKNTKNGLYTFRGIRYAFPPTANERFTRPRYMRLQGDINATMNGSPCPQPNPNQPNKVVGTEDCLLLNIYTPQMPDESAGLPVVVWIHGGGFRYGSAGQYGGEPLNKEKIIFVPIQYRLGTLGIIGDGSKEFSGNVALFDMSVAIRWVNEYIQYFGGDPKNIKVMGQGSGAASAMYIAMSKNQRDSITGVVAMSGTALSQYTLDKEPIQSVEDIAKINNCPHDNETEILNCLRGKSFEDIVLGDSNVQTERLQGREMIKSLTGMVGTGPVIEGTDDKRGLPGFLTEDPETTIKNGTFKKIPLLTGVTKHETANGLMTKEIQSIFSNANEFLNSLSKSIGLAGFLDINNITGELVTKTLPGLGLLKLTDYLKIPETLSPTEILSKLTEVTTDALFNLPAFLTVDKWSKVAPSFLYSFEYLGTSGKGYHFLNGLPIVSKNKVENTVAHGDELIYLFDAFDLFGNPIEEAKINSENDQKARETFVKIIAEFSRFREDSPPKKQGLFSIFSSKGSPFIKIGEKAALENDFNFCGLSIWGATPEAVGKTTSCSKLADGLKGITGLTKGLTGVLNVNPSAGKNKKRPSGGLLGLG